MILKVKKLVTNALELILSPTYFFADYKKSKSESENLNIGPMIKKFNIIYLVIASLIALGLYIYPPTQIYKKGLGDPFIYLALLIIWIYPLSRANEIIYAFYRDAIEKLNGKPSRSNLKYGERIQLAVKSYIELILNFASIYILLPPCFFDDKITSYADALYFSGVTITTLGYGDISPSHAFPQFLSIYQVLCGFSLIVVSFAVYTARGIEVNTENDTVLNNVLSGIKKLSLENTVTRVSKESKLYDEFLSCFIKDKNRPFLWESLKMEPTFKFFDDGKGFTNICKIVPDENEVVWFMVEDDSLPNYPIFKCSIKDAVKIIGECYVFDYYIIPESKDWLLCETHHGHLVGVGKALCFDNAI